MRSVQTTVATPRLLAVGFSIAVAAGAARAQVVMFADVYFGFDEARGIAVCGDRIYTGGPGNNAAYDANNIAAGPIGSFYVMQDITDASGTRATFAGQWSPFHVWVSAGSSIYCYSAGIGGSGVLLDQLGFSDISISGLAMIERSLSPFDIKALVVGQRGDHANIYRAINLMNGATICEAVLPRQCSGLAYDATSGLLLATETSNELVQVIDPGPNLDRCVLRQRIQESGLGSPLTDLEVVDGVWYGVNGDGVGRTSVRIQLGCATADFNGDGDAGTDADIEAFFACLGGNCCPRCWSGGADFNGDGDTGTDADIESFFRVLGGGAC